MQLKLDQEKKARTNHVVVIGIMGHGLITESCQLIEAVGLQEGE